jgi:hypothetical protein
MRTATKITAAAVAAILALSACGVESGGGGTEKEEQVGDDQLDQYLQSQPVPVFNSSQLRQNMIDIQTAQANATVTTSFFFNQGVTDPIHQCPSIGFPIPGSWQLTNPQKIITKHEGTITLPQLEANGLYTADTTGTTVICVDEDGKGYASYWEGFVSTLAGPAEWDATSKQVVLTGAPTAEFSTGEE